MITNAFVVNGETPPLRGRLRYNVKDSWFITDGVRSRADAVVSIGYLALMIDRETGYVDYVDGYCPSPGWREVGLPRSPSVGVREGRLRFVHVDRLIRGAGYPVSEAREWWPEWVDYARGVLWIGEEPTAAGELVRFAPGASCVMSGAEMLAIVLRPVELPTKRPR